MGKEQEQKHTTSSDSKQPVKRIRPLPILKSGAVIEEMSDETWNRLFGGGDLVVFFPRSSREDAKLAEREAQKRYKEERLRERKERTAYRSALRAAAKRNQQRRRRPQDKSLVYGVMADSLVFIRREEAQVVAKIRHGVATANEKHLSWSQFADIVRQEAWDRVLARIDDFGMVEYLSFDDKFESRLIPGYDDGEWPEWPQEHMLRWLPLEIRSEFGQKVDTMMGDEFLVLPPTSQTQIVSALEKAGYTCVHDQQLIADAAMNQDSTDHGKDTDED